MHLRLACVNEPVLGLREVGNLIHGRDVWVRVDLGVPDILAASQGIDDQRTEQCSLQSDDPLDRSPGSACLDPGRHGHSRRPFFTGLATLATDSQTHAVGNKGARPS